MAEIESVEEEQKNEPLMVHLYQQTLGRFGNWVDQSTRQFGSWPRTTFFGLYLAAAILFSPWPLNLSFIGLFVAVLLLPGIAARTGRVALSQVWPLVLVVLLSGAIGSGLDGNLDGTGVGTYQFAAAAHLVDGRYARLGEASDRTILLACGQPGKGTVTAVANADIETVGLEPWKSRSLFWPTLFGVLAGRPSSLGFHNPC